MTWAATQGLGWKAPTKVGRKEVSIWTMDHGFFSNVIPVGQISVLHFFVDMQYLRFFILFRGHGASVRVFEAHDREKFGEFTIKEGSLHDLSINYGDLLKFDMEFQMELSYVVLGIINGIINGVVVFCGIVPGS